MKHLLVIMGVLILFAGCNMNENKEARIKKLEKQHEQMVAQIEQLESRIQLLESNSVSNNE